MDGRKKVEFRKRWLADDVTVVWVYARERLKLPRIDSESLRHVSRLSGKYAPC